MTTVQPKLNRTVEVEIKKPSAAVADKLGKLEVKIPTVGANSLKTLPPGLSLKSPANKLKS